MADESSNNINVSSLDESVINLNDDLQWSRQNTRSAQLTNLHQLAPINAYLIHIEELAL